MTFEVTYIFYAVQSCLRLYALGEGNVTIVVIFRVESTLLSLFSYELFIY